jgi:hypothetical protein
MDCAMPRGGSRRRLLLEFIYRSNQYDGENGSTKGVGQGEVQSSPVSRILLAALAGDLATIPLGRRLPVGSSHLPAASPSRIIGRLFDVAPRRDCPFHPRPPNAFASGSVRDFASRLAPTRRLPRRPRLVSVALILTSRWAGVTCYAALRSPDFPRLRWNEDAVARRTLHFGV